MKKPDLAAKRAKIFGLLCLAAALLLSIPAFGAGIAVDGREIECDFVNLSGSLYVPAELGLFPNPQELVELNGVSYAPLRLNCGLLGYGVAWNAETGTADISTNPGPAIESVHSSAGYALLNDKNRERFDSFVFGSGAITGNIYGAAASLLDEGGFLSKSPDEQAQLLLDCLKIAPFELVDAGDVPDLGGGAAVEMGEKSFIPEYDVWRGSQRPVWVYDAAMSDGYKVSVFTTVEDSPVAEASARALARFPLSVRKYLRRLIYIDDAANTYNGSEDTIWIRLDHAPNEAAIARTLAHELGHVIDRSLTSDYTVWDKAINADAVSLSSYGNGNRDEDLAEFSRLYFMSLQNPAAMEAVELIYPNRLKAFKALLYAADSEFYKDFEAEFNALSPYSDTEPVYAAIAPKNSRLVLTAVNENGTSGGSVLLAKNEGKDTQLWWIRKRSDGGVAIVNKATGFCVSVPGSGNDNGLPLVTWDSPGRANETWTVSEKDGAFSFQVRHSGLYLGFNDFTAVQSSSETFWVILGEEN